MKNKTFDQSGRSAAAPIKNTPSAKELAELYLTTREDFFSLDLEEVTNGWSLNYIFDFLYYIRNIDLFDDIIEWLAECWKSKHQYYNSYDKVSDNDLELNYIDFKAKLQFIKAKLLERFESEKHTEELRAKMLAGYRRNTTKTQVRKESQPEINTKTQQPVFVPALEDETDYHIELSSLRKDIQKKILVSQTIFNVYVNQLNTDIWPLTVSTNRGKYCDPLRFLSIKHEIFSENMEREDFDYLLHEVVVELKDQPSLMSSMGRCSLTSSQKMKSSLACYDSPLKNHRDKVWQLIKDCEPLEEGLQPVCDAMTDEALATKQQIYKERQLG